MGRLASLSAALVLATLVGGCAGGAQSPTPAATKPTEQAKPVTAPSASPAPAKAAAVVEIKGFVFEPQEITIPVGASLTWTNGDATQHTVTADDRSYDSGLLPQGRTFSHTFTAPGRYGYYCVPHGAPGSGQFGTVIVQ